MRNRFIYGLLASLALAAISCPARAQNGPAVCEVSEQPDGFVALRDAPSPKGRLLARMLPDAVVTTVFSKGKQVTRGNWWRVSYEPADDGKPGAKPKPIIGWVNSRLMTGCDI